MASAQVTWDGDCDQFWDGGCSPVGFPDVNLTNWNTEGIPGPMDDVFIGAEFSAVGNVDIELVGIETRGPLRVERDFLISSYADVDNITIECDPGNVQVGGLLETGGGSTWKSGDITAGGFENVGTLTLEGNTAALIATTFDNLVTVIASGARQLRNGARIINTGAWTVATQNASVTGGLGDPTVLFRSTGTLRRTGTGIAAFSVPFEGSGSLEVDGGALAFTDRALINGLSGTFSNGGQIELLVPAAKETHFTGNSLMIGRGDFTISGPGPCHIDGTLAGRLDESSTHGLYFAQGSAVVLNGTAANEPVSKAEWSGASISGPGRFDNQGGLLLRSADLSAHLRVTGTGEVRQRGNLRLGEGGFVEIEDGGEWILESGDVLNLGGTNRFLVRGELRKPIESIFSSDLNVPLITEGRATVRVAGETLALRGGGRLGGTSVLEAESGGLLTISQGTFTSGLSASTVTVRGAGVVRLDPGARWELQNPGDVVRFEVTASETTGFNLNGGTLAAPNGGRFENNGNFVWSTGTISGGAANLLGTGGFTNGPGGKVFITSRATLDGAFLNEGLVTHSSGALTLTSEAGFLNRGDYHLTGTAGIQGEGTFQNRGGSLASLSGSHTVSCPFDADRGRVAVSGGTLSISKLQDPAEDGVLSTGTWEVSLFGTLNISGPTIRRLRAPASVNLSGGSFPALDLEVIEEGATFENTFDSLLDGDLRNSGWLKTGALLDAPALCNEEFGELEAMLPMIEELGGGTGFTTGIKTTNGFENNGHAYPGGHDQPGYLPVTGTFTQQSTGVLHFDLHGGTNAPAAPAQFDQLAVSGAATLDGLAVVTLTPDLAATIAPTDQFTIVRAIGGVLGAFANAPNGGRLFTADGSGSFRATYGPDTLVLSEYLEETPPALSALPELAVEANPDRDLLILTLTGTPGRRHRLETSPDLETWNPLRDAVPNLGGRFRTTRPRDPSAPTELLRFVVPALMAQPADP